MKRNSLLGLILLMSACCLLAGGCPRPSAQPATQPPAQPAKELTLDLGDGVTMKLVLIPAGHFLMGSPAGEEGREENEGPQREVTISKPFYMGVYEVTQAQYEQLIRKNPSYFAGDQNPVERISWDDAVAFCQALSRKTGKSVHLPTEAQWEYACRAGTTTRFYFGDGADYRQLDDYVWSLANSDEQTRPVGQKKPNAWGLYDMHGNVWEWCGDWYTDSYVNAVKIDPAGPASGSDRALRGGSWRNLPQRCRSASRYGSVPGLRYNGVGFRVAVDSE